MAWYIWQKFCMGYQWEIGVEWHYNEKLENCVCKTQVMPPCPKPVLTPCPILTHDPQHIQSILETNVWNVKVKIAVILSKIIFLSAKQNHAHLQYAFNSCAKFQNECLKTLRGVDYTILLPLNETEPENRLSPKCRNFVKNNFLAC